MRFEINCLGFVSYPYNCIHNNDEILWFDKLWFDNMLRPHEIIIQVGFMEYHPLVLAFKALDNIYISNNVASVYLITSMVLL